MENQEKKEPNKSPYIFIRGLKHADHTVFGVQKGQKTYYDQVFGRYLPYSSGQQVKRSILQAFLAHLNKSDAPTEFFFKLTEEGGKKSLGEGEVLSICDPSYPDQLVGGWMRIVTGGGERGVKRRSPLSISALKALHPLLAGISARENITFDRSDKPQIHSVKVRDSNGREMSDEEIEKLLSGSDRSLLRKWIPDDSGSNARANGLFVYDIAIDLRTLFCVSLSQKEPELRVEKGKSFDEVVKILENKGWKKSKNIFGDCLVCPKEDVKDEEGKIIQLGRDSIIKALAKSIIQWRITSNQARTFNLQETLAVSISDNANKIASAIRAKLIEEGDELKAKPIIESLQGVETYIDLSCAGYVVTTNESSDALNNAEQKLIELMMAFDYENQI